VLPEIASEERDFVPAQLAGAFSTARSSDAPSLVARIRQGDTASAFFSRHLPSVATLTDPHAAPVDASLTATDAPDRPVPSTVNSLFEPSQRAFVTANEAAASQATVMTMMTTATATDENHQRAPGLLDILLSLPCMHQHGAHANENNGRRRPWMGTHVSRRRREAASISVERSGAGYLPGGGRSRVPPIRGANVRLFGGVVAWSK